MIFTGPFFLPCVTCPATPNGVFGQAYKSHARAAGFCLLTQPGRLYLSQRLYYLRRLYNTIAPFHLLWRLVRMLQP